jgi:hypothetical protein
MMHKGKINIIHSAFDPADIRVNERRAISEAFCLVTSGVTIGSVDYELGSHMRLASRLEKITPDGPWRMLSLESTYVRDRLVPVFPSTTTAEPMAMSTEI